MRSVVIAVAAIIAAVIVAVVVTAPVMIVPAALIAIAIAPAIVVTVMMMVMCAAAGEQHRGKQGKLSQTGQHDDFLESTLKGRWRGYDHVFPFLFPGVGAK
ncbi:hypothetical protein ACIP1T_21545 [Pseudomonas japonica]|uniref:hypothetical protein n=1 Tax=Pseudomonas japonica TaxID=256466 RepID=UPI0037F732AF